MRTLQFYRNKVFGIFSKAFRSNTGNSGSRHLKKLLSGPKILVDGKVFVKVKLRFVDSWDFTTTRFVDRLETEVESQKQEIEKLSALLADNHKLIDNLQVLNINLQHDIKAMPARLSEKIANLTAENQNKQNKVNNLIEECRKLSDRIQELKGQVGKFQKTIAEKDQKIKSLEQKILWLKPTDKGIVSLVNSNSKLRNELKSSESKLKSIMHETKEKDAVIALLTKRVMEKENKIYMLEVTANGE